MIPNSASSSVITNMFQPSTTPDSYVGGSCDLMRSHTIDNGLIGGGHGLLLDPLGANGGGGGSTGGSNLTSPSEDIWDMDSNTVKRYSVQEPGPFDPLPSLNSDFDPSSWASGGGIGGPMYGSVPNQSQFSASPNGSPDPEGMWGYCKPASAVIPPPTSMGGGSMPSENQDTTKRGKIHQCAHCDKWFTSSGHLKRHFNTTLHKNAMRHLRPGSNASSSSSSGVPSLASSLGPIPHSPVGGSVPGGHQQQQQQHHHHHHLYDPSLVSMQQQQPPTNGGGNSITKFDTTTSLNNSSTTSSRTISSSSPYHMADIITVTSNSNSSSPNVVGSAAAATPNNNVPNSSPLSYFCSSPAASNHSSHSPKLTSSAFANGGISSNINKQPGPLGDISIDNYNNQSNNVKSVQNCLFTDLQQQQQHQNSSSPSPGSSASVLSVVSVPQNPAQSTLQYNSNVIVSNNSPNSLHDAAAAGSMYSTLSSNGSSSSSSYHNSTAPAAAGAPPDQQQLFPVHPLQQQQPLPHMSYGGGGGYANYNGIGNTGNPFVASDNMFSIGAQSDFTNGGGPLPSMSGYAMSQHSHPTPPPAARTPNSINGVLSLDHSNNHYALGGSAGPSQQPLQTAVGGNAANKPAGKKGPSREKDANGEFRCVECQKSFQKLCYLKQHNKSFHNGEKPYKCGQCGKRYPQEGLYQVKKINQYNFIFRRKKCWVSCILKGRRN